jgi:hypothetical protein
MTDQSLINLKGTSQNQKDEQIHVDTIYEASKNQDNDSLEDETDDKTLVKRSRQNSITSWTFFGYDVLEDPHACDAFCMLCTSKGTASL